ncbi:ORF162 [Saltwater crocodilepox virus]|nr:virion core protein P4b [Saltwater crocodilepox virus]QGT46599.1 ORF162 [Saltwater crocodilepox virus]QGT46816.1 ORF162 [Saltwater crocodilepox virus]QGT47031.1 ORF162 [Saltwater crocodilepox virus]QGT47244.1 ORF162 [Saltwater crocodilepox virus]
MADSTDIASGSATNSLGLPACNADGEDGGLSLRPETRFATVCQTPYTDLLPDHVHNRSSGFSCSVCMSLQEICAGSGRAGAKASRSGQRRGAQTPPGARRGGGGGADDRDMSLDEISMAQDWNVRLRADGNAIIKYINSRKMRVEDFSIQDLMTAMKELGIYRTQKNELFELFNYIKGYINTANVSVKTTHPLMVVRNASSPMVEEQFRTLDRVYNTANYYHLMNVSRLQSQFFVDMASSSDILFDYGGCGKTSFVHPILVALFGTKLPALENTVVYGDTYSLLKQFRMRQKVKPENFLLLINRLTETSPILISGITDTLSTEIQRANIHMLIRKLIVQLRMGCFNCDEADAIENYLLKIIHPMTSQAMADEEQMLHSVLSIFGFRPALVSVPRVGTGSFDYVLQAVPYIVVNPAKMITTVENPISINARSLYCLSYDSLSGRVMYTPQSMPYPNQAFAPGADVLPALQGVSFNRPYGSPVIVHGTLIYFVERRQNKGIISGECLGGFRSIISDKAINVEQEMFINGIMYRLRSAVCYKVSDALSGDRCDGGNLFLQGYYAIVFTEEGPWVYDPYSIYTKEGRESRLTRAMRNYFGREQGEVGEYMDWMKTEEAARVFEEKRTYMNSRQYSFYDEVISMPEAMSLVSKYACILAYSEDYDNYVAAKSISDIFV